MLPKLNRRAPSVRLGFFSFWMALHIFHTTTDSMLTSFTKQVYGCLLLNGNPATIGCQIWNCMVTTIPRLLFLVAPPPEKKNGNLKPSLNNDRKILSLFGLKKIYIRWNTLYLRQPLSQGGSWKLTLAHTQLHQMLVRLRDKGTNWKDYWLLRAQGWIKTRHECELIFDWKEQI